MGKKLIKKDFSKIQHNLTSISENDVIPPELMKILEDKMPEWLKEYEADGTAIVRWTFEHLILIEYLLQTEFNFSESELSKLEKKLKELLPNIMKLKAETPRIMTKSDYYIVTEMVERNKKLFNMEKSGIKLPSPIKLIK